MSNITKQITGNVWAILTYEEAWKSYINSYVIAKHDTFLLIDSHLRKQRSYFQQALQQIGIKDGTQIIAYFTHRHADHIGNAEMFPSRYNWIHLDDFYELDDFSQTLFGHTFTGSGGDLNSLQFRHIPFHTEGSVAFFDSESKVCFIGDHLSFFAAPLGSVVGPEQERRDQYLQFITKWKDLEPTRVESYVQGLQTILNWPVEFLATGHGPILEGEIHAFIKQIIAAVTT